MIEGSSIRPTVRSQDTYSRRSNSRTIRDVEQLVSIKCKKENRRRRGRKRKKKKKKEIKREKESKSH